MFDANKCKIRIRINNDEKTSESVKAFVEFTQDSTRLSGFMLCDAKYGMYLVPPKINKKMIFFDENKDRHKALQEAVIGQYNNEVSINDAIKDEPKKSDTSDTKKDEEIDLNEIPF